jgi:hypothetical protein
VPCFFYTVIWILSILLMSIFFCLHFLHHFHHFWLSNRFTHIWHHSIIILFSIMPFIIISDYPPYIFIISASCFSSFQDSFHHAIILVWFFFIISIIPSFHHVSSSFLDSSHFSGIFSSSFYAFVIQKRPSSFDIISSLAIVFMISVLLSDFESTWFVDWNTIVH